MVCSPLRTSTAWAYLDSHNLNFSNRPVRIRMPGGVAGVQSTKTAPYADFGGSLISMLIFDTLAGLGIKPMDQVRRIATDLNGLTHL